MEEVDSILIHTLTQIGCDVNTNISNFSPIQIIKCVSRCFQLIRPELQLPDYDGNISMSARYKVASEIAQAIKDLGYKEEIGCQSFLYPTEEETRKLLIFMMEKLPKDIDSDIGGQVETLLSRIAQDNEESNENNIFSNTNGIEVGGIRLPSAVDINKLPKETLRFYASHLAEISFAKAREKFKQKEPQLPQDFLIEHPSSSSDDDDFGDPDEDIPEVSPPISVKQIEQEEKTKPVILPKPKPPIKEKPNLSNNKKKAIDEERNRALEAFNNLAQQVNSLQHEAKTKALGIKTKEKQVNNLNQTYSKLEEDIEKLRFELEQKEKLIQRQRKTRELLSGNEDALEKVRNAVEAQMKKLIFLAQEWEKLKGPLVDELQAIRLGAENSEGLNKAEQIRCLKIKLKEMGHEAKSKEQLYEQLVRDYEKMPKDLNRSSYTKRICEIIGNIRKQKKEITNVLKDTKAIQKDINTLSGRLDRTFAVADELIYKNADKDKNVAQSYKLLVAIHSDFSRLIKSLEDIGNFKRLARDLEDKLDLEREKNIVEKLERLKADLAQMKHENQVLQAKLRGPALIASKKL